MLQLTARARSASQAQLIFTILIFVASCSSCVLHAQLTISATTPSTPGSATTPNTFIGTVGSQIAASLLATSTPVLLWGSVPSGDVNEACQNIVNTGSLSVTASITDDWGGSEDVTLQVEATGGCLAASDASGTEFVFTDNYGRKSAIVCPSNAGSTGCGVYLTGDDVNNIYSSYYGGGGSKKRRLLSYPSGMANRRLLADTCQQGAAEGAITGAVTGILGTADCLALGPLAPFCVIGVLGVSAELGALGGCVASCFPGDATVKTRHGTGSKLMSQLQVGDEVAVWDPHHKVITFEDVYAFGHKDANATAVFVHLDVANGATYHTLRLTPMHFVPTHGDNNKVIYKRAQDIQLGDIVYATPTLSNEHVVPCIVKDISTSRMNGLYNPFTMSGTILVDNVVASVHSEWFLDSTFDSLGLTHILPLAYQLIMTPARFIYTILGKDMYIATYNWIDARVDIATFGTKFGGRISILALTTSLSATFTLYAITKLHSRNS